jgi:hypothetical protein
LRRGDPADPAGCVAAILPIMHRWSVRHCSPVATRP